MNLCSWGARIEYSGRGRPAKRCLACTWKPRRQVRKPRAALTKKACAKGSDQFPGYPGPVNEWRFVDERGWPLGFHPEGGD